MEPRYGAGDFVATDSVAAEPNNAAEEVIVTEEHYFATLAPSPRDEPYLMVPESGGGGPLPEDTYLAEEASIKADPKGIGGGRSRGQAGSFTTRANHRRHRQRRGTYARPKQ